MRRRVLVEVLSLNFNVLQTSFFLPDYFFNSVAVGMEWVFPRIRGETWRFNDLNWFLEWVGWLQCFGEGSI